MRLETLRHPLATGLAVLLLLLSGASDAVGSRACAHHAHAGHGEHVEQAEGDHHDHHRHHGHHGHHGHHEPAHAEDEPSPDCDCGFLCFAVTGPPPVRPAPESVLRTPPPPAPLATLLVTVPDPRIRPALLPHALPFSQGPPTRS